MGTREATAKRIKDFCKEKNMTMYRLCALSGVPHSTLLSILNGSSNNPGIETIRKLCSAFGVSLSQFFDSDDFD